MTLHWGTTHYLQGIAPPGVGQDGGCENGHKRVGKGCLEREIRKDSDWDTTVGAWCLTSNSWDLDEVG